jgi:hypothetical protein
MSRSAYSLTQREEEDAAEKRRMQELWEKIIAQPGVTPITDPRHYPHVRFDNTIYYIGSDGEERDTPESDGEDAGPTLPAHQQN